MIHYRITPDHKIDNRGMDQIARELNRYKNPIQRWNGKGIDRQTFWAYEIAISKQDIGFYFTVPDSLDKLARKSLETAFPDSTIESVAEPFEMIPNHISKVDLKEHSLFSIKVDRRENKFLYSLLDLTKLLDSDDRIFVQVLNVPASIDWYIDIVDAYKKFKSGKIPRKFKVDSKSLAKEGTRMVARGVLSTIDGLIMLTGGKPEKINLDESERFMMIRDGGLSRETMNKTKNGAYDTTIRVAIQSKNHETIQQAIDGSFYHFNGDNEFYSYPINPKTSTKLIQDRRSGMKVGKNYLSVPELCQVVQVPNKAIQEKYKINSIDRTETTIPGHLKGGGMLLGTHTIKGQETSVFMPVKDWDELCLPRIVIGGMGQGKSRGYGANLLYQAVQNGFGGIIFDPAKGEIGDELEKVLGPDQLIRINVAEKPISIDWSEIKRSKHARNRLANTIISFFNTNGDDAGAQTTRFIRALIMAMQTDKLSEIVQMIYDIEFLKSRVQAMPESIHRNSLDELINYSDGRRMQILGPIMNRLDVILGDTFLYDCLENGESLDMVDIINSKKAVVIDVPKKDLGPEGIEIVMNLFTTKLDLAMTLREEPEPFFAVFDEPHQYIKSHHQWKSATVESRKWRIGYVWLFHEWTQIESDLRKIIRSSLPHYTIYPSSKHTFQDLKEEIQPFTLDDAMKLKRYHAINVIRSGGQTIKPFMAKMTRPPSEQ